MFRSTALFQKGGGREVFLLALPASKLSKVIRRSIYISPNWSHWFSIISDKTNPGGLFCQKRATHWKSKPHVSVFNELCHIFLFSVGPETMGEYVVCCPKTKSMLLLHRSYFTRSQGERGIEAVRWKLIEVINKWSLLISLIFTSLSSCIGSFALFWPGKCS